MMMMLIFVEETAAHGAVSYPPPRNGIDGSVAPWNGTVPDYPLPFEFWCAKPMAGSTDPRNLTGSNGQACFWFSNGCDISCDECDGQTGQLVHPKFVSDADVTGDWWTGKGIGPDPTAPKAKPRSICANPKRNATICDPKLRTVNTNAECGSEEDFYYFAPWRAPGTAPVIDACGVAGGRLPGQGPGSAGADYQETIHAKRGDRGSKLPKQPSGTEWKVGTAVEVGWTVKAFHGGGYQYRLCPADSDLTEKCFQSHPLDFIGQSSLRWGGLGGKQIFFNATYATEGTSPAGSMWAKTPIPRGPWGFPYNGLSFEPICKESAACANSNDTHKKPSQMTCMCSGDGIGDLPTLEIIDQVMIPNTITPGEWVLGWRWDCEESTQVWASCSDVTIVKN